ncbi:thiol:disulfide interchange protein [Brumimicrobium oceani]|uniref:Thiol:disulfide interchange protein n=2 Tax=Brumimicrobium oceani TaxID=2100725 RepID=A0A2U2XCF1_9FLAO|nr:thiol:disulfide interchange protein [Brumimicrobium oceani]
MIVFGFYGFSQVEYPEDKVKWSFKVKQSGCDAEIIGEFTVDDHWHINALTLPADNFGIPTTFKVQKSPNYKIVGKVIEPKPVEEYDEVSEENLRYHAGTFTLKQKIKITTDKDFELKLDFGFQPCDSVKCLFPFEDVFTVQVKGCEIKVEKADDGLLDASDLDSKDPLLKDDLSANPEEGNDVSQEEESAEMEEEGEDEAETLVVTKDGNKKQSKSDPAGRSLWWIFAVSFGSGLIALVTPCVFPMIPMTVSFFTKQSKTKKQGINNAIKYGISIIVIYIVLGILVTAIFGADSLNKMSTDPVFNLVFFLLLVVFAISFMGAFEISLPSAWANKADSKADKGGFLGIFFMALALALVSFSCTGPIVGILLVQAASEGGLAPFVGMFGFSLALALPFALFAAFPGWLNTLPKSGGWLNSVKVVLGFLELALAFKFLSNADLALQWHLLEREVFLAIWIGIFLVLALYLFGKLRLPHDSPVEKLSVGRTLFGTTVLIFVIYLIPGMWGAPLKIISAFPPPMSYSEAPLGFGGGGTATVSKGEFIEGTHLGPQNIMVFHDYDKALAHANKVNKPLMVDFTGHNCVNCRKMEQSVWGEPGIIEMLRDDVVIVSLYVDERVDLPKDEQKTVTYPNGREKNLKTVGDKNSFKQVSEYQVTAQPYYIFQNGAGEDLEVGPADYENHSNPAAFKQWLEEGLNAYNAQK